MIQSGTEQSGSWQQIRSRIKLSPAVICLTLLYLLFYVITEILHSQKSHALEITPSDVFAGSIWQIVTAGFTENYIICIVINLNILILSNRFLEPVWGVLEYAKFIFVVNIATYSLNLVIYFIGYIVIREEKFLYVPFCGGQGLVGGMLVGVKQLIPDHVIIKMFPALRVRHLPLSMFFIALLFTILRITSTRYLTVTIAGLASSWVYLRYFQLRETGRGDFSEALSLASFFPESAQPHVLRYSTVVSNIVDGLLQKRDNRTIELKTLSPGVNISTDPISERRRQLALQALNERLQQKEDVEWPSSGSDPENIV